MMASVFRVVWPCNLRDHLSLCPSPLSACHMGPLLCVGFKLALFPTWDLSCLQLPSTGHLMAPFLTLLGPRCPHLSRAQADLSETALPHPEAQNFCTLSSFHFHVGLTLLEHPRLPPSAVVFVWLFEQSSFVFFV